MANTKPDRIPDTYSPDIVVYRDDLTGIAVETFSITSNQPNTLGQVRSCIRIKGKTFQRWSTEFKQKVDISDAIILSPTELGRIIRHLETLVPVSTSDAPY